LKVLQINSVCGVGSTGRIVADLHEMLTETGFECKIAFGRGRAYRIPVGDTIKIGNEADIRYHALMTRITDRTGFYSKSATSRLIGKIKEYDPDIIHLHNLHGYYINTDLLFGYLKESGKPIIWTLHDCWAFTGHCAHFDYIGCGKWKTACCNCAQKTAYPKSVFFDNSETNFRKKKELFTSVENMVLVTPSNWLAGLVRESFFRQFQVKVINNGIDLQVFQKRESDFRHKHNLQNTFIMLGVANVWTKSKGFDVFIELAGKLGENQKIVLIGLPEKRIKGLPDSIIGIARTSSLNELADIYSAADVFINPSREDTFGLVNVEALACGLPVIAYNTSGSAEIICENCGITVERDDVIGIADSINRIRAGDFSADMSRKCALKYDKAAKYTEYLELYREIV